MGAIWRLESAASDLWTPPQWLSADAASPHDVRLHVFRAGAIEVALQAPPGETLPTTADVRLSGAPGKALKLAPTTISCPVTKARLQCTVPAGVLDLRFKLGAFVPLYQWDVDVATGKPKELARWPLLRGASIVGTVKGDGAAGQGSIEVSLAPEVRGVSTDPAVDQRLASLRRRTTATARGFFQFEVVEPGSYALEAEQKGFVRTKVSPVEVKKGLETELHDPLVLAKPAAAKIQLDPPVDPYGKRWEVTLGRRDPASGHPTGEWFTGSASVSGVWEKSGLAAGGYLLSVAGAGRTRWLDQVVEVQPGMEPLRVEIPVLQLKGRVLRGKEPLEGELWFGGQFGTRRVHFESDAKGVFEGLLPGPGKWDVDVVVKQPYLRLSLKPVEVEVPKGKSYATVEVHVPNTILHGEVVDEQSHPLPAASLMIQSPHRLSMSQLSADEEGKFEVRGLEAGSVLLSAESGERTSGWVQTTIAEGEDGPALRLVAQRKMLVQGRVVSPAGPVPGARLHALPDIAQTGIASLVEEVTGPDGGFSLSFPAGTSWVDLIVSSPGNATRMLRTPVDAKTFLEVPVEPDGGTLVFDLQGDSSRQEAASVASLFHGGTEISLQEIARWAGGLGIERRGANLALRDMEPGDYLLCVGVKAHQAMRGGIEPPANRCSRAALAPLSEAVVPVPARR
ncbi:MAG TPA: carboxypeptidase-like regulatory domain-containing protein [Thermoanaerobaculia bacterium]